MHVFDFHIYERWLPKFFKEWPYALLYLCYYMSLFYLCGKISPYSQCQHAPLLCGCFGPSVLHLYVLECLTAVIIIITIPGSHTNLLSPAEKLQQVGTYITLSDCTKCTQVYKNPSSDWHQLWNHETVWNNNRAQAFSPGWAEIRWCVVLSSGVTVEISSDSSDLPAK